MTAGKELALAFGLDHIVTDTGRPNDAAASIDLANTAMTRGKPALPVESGDWPRTDEKSTDRLEQGVAVEPGQTVSRGTLLAPVTEFHGTVLEEIRLPFAGAVLYIVAAPPISHGEPVGFVAERAAGGPEVKKWSEVRIQKAEG